MANSKLKMKTILYILLIFPLIMSSQEKITGMIMEANEQNEHIGLAGANEYWLNTSIGTVTDIDGHFSIDYKKEYTKLVISHVGFKTDTLTISESKPIHHWLKLTDNLNE